MIFVSAEAALDVGVADTGIGNPNKDRLRYGFLRHRDIRKLQKLILSEYEGFHL
jgi:hypothetical protein